MNVLNMRSNYYKFWVVNLVVSSSLHCSDWVMLYEGPAAAVVSGSLGSWLSYSLQIMRPSEQRATLPVGIDRKAPWWNTSLARSVVMPACCPTVEWSEQIKGKQFNRRREAPDPARSRAITVRRHQSGFSPPPSLPPSLPPSELKH